MKTTRVLASACLLVSSIALITAASISVGDEPGVVRLSTLNPQAGGGQAGAPGTGVVPAPVPEAGPAAGGGVVYGDPNGPMPYPQPGNYAPYFERSFGATQAAPNPAMLPQQPFGPILMFESNIDNGLGYAKGYHRLNARIPYHILPNTTVMLGDLSASVTNNGDPLYNYGLVYRNYDEAMNRIFGWNVFGDYDQGYGNTEWYRMTFGLESLGKYIDWRANGYFMVGGDSFLLSDTLTGNLSLAGNNVFLLHQQTRENAYSGFDVETGGPLPLLGRYGLNMYVGGYYLGNDTGFDTPGFQARWEALITESITVNTYLTTDDTFGTNSWVSMQFNIPNYKNKRILRPSSVRDRLQDPVIRSNRVHTNIDQVIAPEAVVNAKTGLPWFITYVNPNAAAPGDGTIENPFRTLQQAEDTNNALVDIIRVTPRTDDTGTNLTANGGLHLFDCQVLLSSTKDFTLFNLNGQDFIIPGEPTPSNLGPLISNPTMVAGGSVVHLANQNQIIGMRINAANAGGTVFGNGVSNALPITDVSLVDNTFTNYSVGANLQDVTGRVIVDGNTFTGITPVGTSQQGLLLTSAVGQTMELLMRDNTATNNALAGLSVTAQTGSTINADNPAGNGGNPETGIFNNTLTANGNGIELLGETGSVINASVENNTIRNSTINGVLAKTDGGTFNLASLRGNTIVGNYDANVLPTTAENGVLLYYQNGGTFFAQSEDRNEDLNFNGILDVGEDTDGDGILDVANGTLDAGEDLNGNGVLDQGIVSNIITNNVGVGLCIFGETAGTGAFTIGGPAASLGNQIRNNGNAGVAVDLNGTATASIDSMFNQITEGAFQRTYSTRVEALFTMSGDTRTAPAVLTNQSATGDITQFTWDLNFAPGFQDWEFDTTPGIAGLLGTPFTPLAGSDVTTGLFLVNDVNVPPYNAPMQAVLDSAQQLKLDFVSDAVGNAGFDQNEQMAFNLDVDPRGLNPDTPPDNVVIANQLVGTTGTVQFRDDFSGNAVQSLRTLTGTFVQSTTDPQGIEFQVGQTFTAPLFDAGRQGSGVRVNAVDNAVVTRFNSINDNISRNGGDGLSVVARNNARVDALTVQGATIEQNNGRGLNIEAHDNAVIQASSTIGGFDLATGGVNIISGASFTEANSISRNSSDGIRVLASNGGTVNGNVINNTIEENLGDGVALAIENGGTLDFGTPASNRVISRNSIQRNNGAGIRLTSNVSSASQGQLNAVLNGNTVNSNLSGGVVANLNGPNNTPPNPPALINNNVLNLTVAGTPALPQNTFIGNGDVGIGVNVTGNGLANVDIRNATIAGTFDGADPILNGDGINLRRADSSLLQATVEDVTSTFNAGDGLDVEVQGNDKTDPNQPFSGTVNTVDWNRNNLSSNGQNGARFRTRGEAMLIADGQTNTLSNNGQNGILVQTSETSTFGDATDGLPPGRRVLFDGNTLTNNGVDGLQIVATDNSRALVEVNSTAIAPLPGPHAALSSAGSTNISNNARDGVHIETTGGTSDIVITANTAQTLIDGNGTGAGGGNGIRWDASGTSNGTVRVSRTTISNSIAGASEDTNGDGVLALNEDANLNGILDSGEDLNGNGTLDLGEDVNANQDLDVANGDGIQFNVANNATATLVVGELGEDLNLNGVLDPGEDSNGNGVIDVGIGNMIQNNGDDGVAVTLTGGNGLGTPNPQIAIVGNTIGGEAGGLAAGNGGDGISFNTFGDRSQGSGDIFAELGPQGQLRVAHNLISQNDNRGANILLNGAGGIRDREGVGAGTFSPILVSFASNDILSNGMEGIFYQASPGYVQNRSVLLGNTGFPGDNRQPQFTGVNNIGLGTGNNANGSQAFYAPNLFNFTSLNIGSVNGNTAYQAPYLNLSTEQNSFLTVTNNVIQNNGTGTVTGEGLVVRVGVNAYVAADVQNNTFGGNLQEDFRTESFRYAANPDNLVDNSGIGTFDVVFLDDTAQFDLRFQNNTGNQIRTESAGAAFTNGDVAKVFQPGVPNVLNRPVALFQVENGANLDNPNNTFINFGITQPINASFATGGYNIRAAADPLFPNIGFAPFLP